VDGFPYEEQNMSGTRLDTEVVRVVDGDTIRAVVNGGEESLRILALDTEESNAGGSKPETPWGHEAKGEAKRLVSPGDTVSLEFPGSEPLDLCLRKYRGNFGRLLVYVYLADGADYQEHMIRSGYSPYFTKYGYAEFADNHERYITAEREAQAASDDDGGIGVWNQLRVNGQEVRNYAALGVWWYLRAEIIQAYRRLKRSNPALPLYNSRLDFEEIEMLAKQGAEATIFTELRSYRRVGGQHAVVAIGSQRQPFQVFIRNAAGANGQQILRLLDNRYVAGGENHPRRSYAYVTGKLKIFDGRPEIEVTSPDQISDAFSLP
jgi:micrococcal nuclease